MFDITYLNYNSKTDELIFEAGSNPPSIKSFPIFEIAGKRYIFKPLSKTKPLLTPLFAYSEVFNSHLIKKFFIPEMPIYSLAKCQGISDEHPKYYEEGTMVEFVNGIDEEVVSFFKYFKNNPSNILNISNYTNYCMVWYDYMPFFVSEPFFENPQLREQLALQVLISFLIINYNFHYENSAFITKNGKIDRLCPPIDNEFSAMFIFGDDLDMQEKVINDFEDNLFERDHSIVRINIEYIIRRHESVARMFLETLPNLIEYLRSLKLQGNNDYIFPFSSYDYKIGQKRFKEHDESGAARLEKERCPITINEEDYFGTVIDNYIKNAQLLQSFIKRELEKKRLKKDFN